MSKSVLPVFSSRSCMVFGLTFRSLIHFEFNLYFILSLLLCMVWENVLIFILLHVAVQFSQHHLLKRLSFFTLYILASFAIDYLIINVWVYFWTLYSVPLIYVSCMCVCAHICVQHHTVLIIVALQHSLKSRSISPALFFFLKITLAIWGLLWFHINFRSICFSSLKNAVGFLIGIALNL